MDRSAQPSRYYRNALPELALTSAGDANTASAKRSVAENLSAADQLFDEDQRAESKPGDGKKNDSLIDNKHAPTTIKRRDGSRMKSPPMAANTDGDDEARHSVAGQRCPPYVFKSPGVTGAFC
jgi:hypothetical protein